MAITFSDLHDPLDNGWPRPSTEVSKSERQTLWFLMLSHFRFDRKGFSNGHDGHRSSLLAQLPNARFSSCFKAFVVRDVEMCVASRFFLTVYFFMSERLNPLSFMNGFLGSVAGPGARVGKPGSRNPPGQTLEGKFRPSLQRYPRYPGSRVSPLGP